MALDALVDSAQLDSDLTDVADAIRAKTGGTTPLAFPNEFISEIGSISGGGTLPDGLCDISFNISGWAVGSSSNNVITLTTNSSYTSCVFPLNNPISVFSGDVVKIRFTKQPGFGSVSWSDLRIIAEGRIIDSNINTELNDPVNDKTYTAIYDFNLIALYFGSRINTWNNGIYLIELFINDVQIF